MLTYTGFYDQFSPVTSAAQLLSKLQIPNKICIILFELQVEAEPVVSVWRQVLLVVTWRDRVTTFW